MLQFPAGREPLQSVGPLPSIYRFLLVAAAPFCLLAFIAMMTDLTVWQFFVLSGAAVVWAAVVLSFMFLALSVHLGRSVDMRD